MENLCTFNGKKKLGRATFSFRICGIMIGLLIKVQFSVNPIYDEYVGNIAHTDFCSLLSLHPKGLLLIIKYCFTKTMYKLLLHILVIVVSVR